jgi:hypothetical protein
MYIVLVMLGGQIYIAESLIPEPLSFEAKIATEKLKRYTLSHSDELPEELIQAESNTLCSEIHRLITLPHPRSTTFNCTLYYMLSGQYSYCHCHHRL